MLRKKNRNIRTKTDNDDEEDINLQVPVAKIAKKKTKNNKSVLSFGNEEEGDETFKVTKSSASRRMVQAKSKQLHLNQLNPLNLDQATISSPSYTKEYLSELRQISGIPDANAIHAAKKKREMLRQKSAFLDYIPLDDSEEVDSVSEKKIESRLVREDDEMGDADEELGQYVEEKLPLGKKAEKEHQRLKKAGIKEMLMEVDFDDEDDEIMQWEMEQIKKGGHFLKTSTNQSQSKKPVTNISIPNVTSIKSISEVQTILDQKMNELRYLHNTHQSELVQIQKNIDSLVKSSEQMENDLQTTKKRYTYFQEIKTFVDDLVEFLDAKFPDLEKLENDIETMLKERSELIMKRIMEDDSDDLVLFSNDNQNKFNINEYVEQQQEIDEFGRVKTPASVNFGVSDAVRQRRRQQRDKRRSKRLQYSTDDEIKMEGLSTDDELGDADERDMTSKIDEISYHKTNLFDDVDDDFKSIYLVKLKFDTWKKEFSEDYSKAYGDLSLPGVFEFYVRYEMLLWRTFMGHFDFSKMEWYRTISGVNDINSSSNLSENDNKILTKIFEKVIIPRAIHLIKVLNPYSSKETKSAIEFCKSLLKFVDKNSPKFKDFTSAISSNLQNVVQAIKHPDTFGLRKSEMDEHAIRSRDRFFWRRYKLMNNLILWKDYIQEDFVRPLVINNMIDQCLLRILDGSPENAIKYQKILEIVPDEWFSPSTLEKIARRAAGI
ncbi:2391_t:CDS:10 [Dentiscutata erythropus]|uniref:2391_t:CDS:1 n=1 Tax=Dentiscutata erythropus TaxID=1348616 RepID=A0A9N9CBB2_9GLOM|nr:2391_t:CDS:10 [Dentiscutata erythropus]